MESDNCTTDHKQSCPIAGSTSFIIIPFVLFVFQSVSLALRIQEIHRGLLLAFPFSHFFHFFTHFLFYNGKKLGGWVLGRRAELDGLVIIRGPLCHTDAETSCQLANLHRLTFITLASSVGRKENGSGMAADGPWHPSTVQYTDTAVKYSVVYARTYTLMHARTTHCRCLPHNPPVQF